MTSKKHPILETEHVAFLVLMICGTEFIRKQRALSPQVPSSE